MSAISLPTKQLNPDLIALIKALAPGDKIRITQSLRVGNKRWPHAVVGAYRGMNYLATGITTDRVAEDDIVVPTLHFTKDNGELASVSLDELTTVERI
ncbi:MAG: hypothetical protein U0798_05135 [Gemmataceae bacterium]